MLGFVFVPQNTVAVVERLSKYDRVLQAGFHFITPCIETLHGVRWNYQNAAHGTTKYLYGCMIPTNDQCYDPDSLKASTNDGVEVEVDMVIYFSITDPLKAAYGVADLFRAIENITETALYGAVRKLSVDNLHADAIEQMMHSGNVNIDTMLSEWGVTIKSLRVQDVTMPQVISDATTELIASKRKSLMEIEKLENEFGRKTKMAKLQMSELKAQHEREKLKTVHEHDETRKAEQLVAETRRLHTDADAYHAKEIAKATSEAIVATGKAKADAMELELLILSKHKGLLEYLRSRDYASAWEKVGGGANSKLIVAPENVLSSIAQLPLVHTLTLASVAPDGS